MATYKFPCRTGEITIDHNKCKTCRTYACAKACSLFSKGLLKIQDGKPVLIGNPEEVKRACVECLGCELMCHDYGNKGLKIKLDMFGLDEYRRKKK